MKIAIFYCDMVRSNLLHTFNKKIQKTGFDEFLENYGGILYKNAYTNFPDTGHGYSMIYSGISCKKNGCDNIGKYPKQHLNLELPNLEKIFKRKKINSYYINTTRNELAGTMPDNISNKILINFKNNTYEEEFLKLKDKLDKEDNSFLMVTFDDYHDAVDEYGANLKSDKKGKEKLNKIFNIFFKIFGKDYFDYTIIFSDHGNVFKYDFDDERILKVLNKDRTNILLHYRKKNDNNLKINYELRSILDIYPTIKEFYQDNTEEKIDGISLNQKAPEKRKIIVESYSKFSYPNPLDIWAVITKEYYYITNIKNSILFDDNGNISDLNKKIKLKEELELLLENETINYKNQKQVSDRFKILSKVLKEEYRYSDNSRLNKFNFTRMKTFKFSRIPIYIRWHLLKGKF